MLTWTRKLRMSSAVSTQPLIACHECDLLQRKTTVPQDGAAKCRRCGAALYRRKRNNLGQALPLTIAATIVLIVTNAYPFLDVATSGNHTSATLLGTVWALHEHGSTAIAALVFGTTILAPALYLGATLYLLVPLKLARIPWGLPVMFRLAHTARRWGMIEVYLLGIFVAYAKTGHYATVVPGTGLWSFGPLVLLLAASAVSLNRDDLWARVDACQTRVRRSGTLGNTNLPPEARS